MSTSVKPFRLSYDDQGSGVPVVLLHGLNFDRNSWRPIIEQLGEHVRTVAIDLPGHGETRGGPTSLWEIAAVVHELVSELGIERPLIVGHSMGGAIASNYAATFPVLGAVNVDMHMDVRPFAKLVRGFDSTLAGAEFSAAMEKLQDGMGLDLVPEPRRTQLLATQNIQSDIVLGYWEDIRHTDPEEAQAQTEKGMQRITAPYLVIFGRELTPVERDYMVANIANLQMEEWPGTGHYLHLVDVDRFTERLRALIEYCTQ